MWVVKLSGELADEEGLAGWLSELVILGGGRVVIVPGCWSSAAFVWERQHNWGFDDVTGANMLALARAQYGLLMHALAPDLIPAITADDIRATLQAGRVAVWMPFSLVRKEPDDLTHMDLSSDCVAAWLASHLNAERLILIKSAAFDASASLEQHVRQGILDERFGQYLSAATCPVDLMHKNDVKRMRNLLLSGTTS